MFQDKNVSLFRQPIAAAGARTPSCKTVTINSTMGNAVEGGVVSQTMLHLRLSETQQL